MSFGRAMKMALSTMPPEFGREVQDAAWLRFDVIDWHLVRKLRAMGRDDGMVASNG